VLRDNGSKVRQFGFGEPEPDRLEIRVGRLFRASSKTDYSSLFQRVRDSRQPAQCKVAGDGATPR
jgi:hypothetical protein